MASRPPSAPSPLSAADPFRTQNPEPSHQLIQEPDDEPHQRHVGRSHRPLRQLLSPVGDLGQHRQRQHLRLQAERGHLRKPCDPVEHQRRLYRRRRLLGQPAVRQRPGFDPADQLADRPGHHRPGPVRHHPDPNHHRRHHLGPVHPRRLVYAGFPGLSEERGRPLPSGLSGGRPGQHPER